MLSSLVIVPLTKVPFALPTFWYILNDEVFSALLLLNSALQHGVSPSFISYDLNTIKLSVSTNILKPSSNSILLT